MVAVGDVPVWYVVGRCGGGWYGVGYVVVGRVVWYGVGYAVAAVVHCGCCGLGSVVVVVPVGDAAAG